jgi:PAB1-binding protein PBP1
VDKAQALESELAR